MHWQSGLQQEGQLKQRGVNPYTIRWYHSFLTSQTQQVSVNATLSESRNISTGAPQGCVRSPILFTLYTNECTSSNPENYIVKSSDDTDLLGLMYKDADTTVYRSEIQRFVKWWDAPSHPQCKENGRSLW